MRATTRPSRRGRSSARPGNGASPRTSTPTGARRRSCYSDDEMPDLRAAHPLNEVMPLLRSTLVEHRRRGHARHAGHRRRRHDPVAGGRRPAAARRRHDGPGSRGFSVSESVDRHQRDGHHAGRRRAGADPLGRAPGARLPHLDVRRGARARPRHRPDPRRDRHQRPDPHHAPGDGPARVGHRAARREPAAGAPGHRRRAPARAQHAAPRRACAAGRARSSRRAGGSSPASRTGSWPERVAVPAGGGRVAARRRARGGGRAARRGLPAARARGARRPARAAARCRCGSPATPRHGPR